MADGAVASWQERFDTDFPDGALCIWDRPGDEQAVIYRVPRIQVTGVVNVLPVVLLMPLENSHPLGPEKLVTYEQVTGSKRWPEGTVRVTFAIAPDAMYWNPKVPSTLLKSMRKARQRLIEEQGEHDQSPGLPQQAGADGGIPSPAEGQPA